MSGDIISKLKPNATVRSPLFPEPVQVIITVPVGDAIKLVGTGLDSGRTYQPILSFDQLATLVVAPEIMPFDGDATLPIGQGSKITNWRTNGRMQINRWRRASRNWNWPAVVVLQARKRCVPECAPDPGIR